MGNSHSSSEYGEQLLQPILPGTISCFGAGGIYRVNLQTGSCQKVIGGKWGGIRSAVRDPEHDVVYAFGSFGLYRVQKDGSHMKTESGNWTSDNDKASRQQTAFYLGDGKAIYVGARHIYKLNLREATHQTIGSSGHWAGCNCAVYANDGFAYVFGCAGVYKLNVTDGTHTFLCDGMWGAVDCAAQVDQDTILCFGGHGIYRLNISDGTNAKVASGMWGGMHCALVDLHTNGVFVFGNMGIYKVNPTDGTYDKVMSGNWGTVHGATYDPQPAVTEVGTSG